LHFGKKTNDLTIIANGKYCKVAIDAAKSFAQVNQLILIDPIGLPVDVAIPSNVIHIDVWYSSNVDISDNPHLGSCGHTLGTHGLYKDFRIHNHDKMTQFSVTSSPGDVFNHDKIQYFGGLIERFCRNHDRKNEWRLMNEVPNPFLNCFDGSEMVKAITRLSEYERFWDSFDGYKFND